MTAADFLILSLACWRVAFLVTNDTFPFSYVRGWVGMTRTGAPLYGLRLKVLEGLDCIRCMSVWAAILMFLLWFTPLQPIVYIAAISGGALMLHKYTGWDYANNQP